MSQTLLFVLLVYMQFLRTSFLAQSRKMAKRFCKTASLVAMTHDGNCCEDFLQFGHSQVVKSSFKFCLRFSIFFSL